MVYVAVLIYPAICSPHLLAQKRLICELPPTSLPVWGLAVSSSGSQVASTGGVFFGGIVVWDTLKREKLYQLEERFGSESSLQPVVHSLEFSLNGQVLYGLSSNRKEKFSSRLRTWNANTGELAKDKLFMGGTCRYPPPLAVSADGSRIAAYVGQPPVRIWDAKNLATLKEIDVAAGELDSLAFSNDGRRLAIVDERRATSLAQVEHDSDLEIVGDRRGLDDLARFAVFSNDGKILVSIHINGDREINIYYWNAETGEKLRHTLLTKLPTLYAYMFCVDLAAYPPTLAVVVKQDTVAVYDLTTGVERARIIVPEQLRMIRLSSSGQYLAAASSLDRIFVWDLNDDEQSANGK